MKLFAFVSAVSVSCTLVVFANLLGYAIATKTSPTCLAVTASQADGTVVPVPSSLRVRVLRKSKSNKNNNNNKSITVQAIQAFKTSASTRCRAGAVVDDDAARAMTALFSRGSCRGDRQLCRSRRVQASGTCRADGTAKIDIAVFSTPNVNINQLCTNLSTSRRDTLRRRSLSHIIITVPCKVPICEDMPMLPPSTAAEEETTILIDAMFSGDTANGFKYIDNAFYNTNNKLLAFGDIDRNRLKVKLGGKTKNGGASGGFVTNFVLDEPAALDLDFGYNLRLGGRADNETSAQALFAINGTSTSFGRVVNQVDGVSGVQKPIAEGSDSASFPVPVLPAGQYSLTVGGFLNKLMGANKAVVTFDDILLETVPPEDVIFEEDFEEDAGGFSYADDTFLDTNNPAYALGRFKDGLQSERSIGVILGGVDDSAQFNMSGGWSKTFFVEESGPISISFAYRVAGTGFEDTNGEDVIGELLVSIDGDIVINLPQFEALRENGRRLQTAEWQQERRTVDIEAGEHTLTAGGRLRGKQGDRTFNLSFDDVAARRLRRRRRRRRQSSRGR